MNFIGFKNDKIYLLICFLASFEKQMDLFAVEQLLMWVPTSILSFIGHQSNNIVYWTALTIKVFRSSSKHLNLLLLFLCHSNSH